MISLEPVATIHWLSLPKPISISDTVRNMGAPAARVSDMHVCPLADPTPHVGGPVLPPGEASVLIAGLPAARVGDLSICVGPPDPIVMGSGSVLIGQMNAARLGDATAHGGVIVAGEPSVLIGG